MMVGSSAGRSTLPSSDSYCPVVSVITMPHNCSILSTLEAYLAHGKPLRPFKESRHSAHNCLMHFVRIAVASDDEVRVLASVEKNVRC
jgi:hypothetical protein